MEIAHASGGTKVAHTSSGQEVVHTCHGAGGVYAGGEAKVARAGGEREDTRARDGQRGVRGERGNAHADGLKAFGRSEGGALGSVIGRCQRAVGPEEQHGQAQHERPVRVIDPDFTLCIRLTRPSNPADFNVSSPIAQLQSRRQECGPPRADQGP